MIFMVKIAKNTMKHCVFYELMSDLLLCIKLKKDALQKNKIFDGVNCSMNFHQIKLAQAKPR